jgi:transposase
MRPVPDPLPVGLCRAAPSSILNLREQACSQEGDEFVTSQLFPAIPMDTVKAVRTVFGSSNFYVAVGDQVNQLFQGLILSNSHKPTHQLPDHLAALYLITIFQYLESLPDNQAANAVRDRRDWKYALHLPQKVSGFQPAIFCEFRKLLLSDQNRLQVLQTLLDRLSEGVISIIAAPANLEAGYLLSRICTFSRLAFAWEAIEQALEVLAIRQPDWLRSIALPYWYERYAFRVKPIDFSGDASELEASTKAIGADMTYLLKALPDARDSSLEELPQILFLKQIWLEQYSCMEGNAVWREESCASCASSIQFGNELDLLAKLNGRW